MPFFLAFLTILAAAKPRPYRLVDVRRELFAMMEEPDLPFRVAGSYGGRGARVFVEYYEREVRPFELALARLERRHSLLSHLLRAGTYLNDEERDEWTAEVDRLSRSLRRHRADVERAGRLEIWASYAHGLTGDLPDQARRLRRDSRHALEVMRHDGEVTEIERIERDLELRIAAGARTDREKLGRQVVIEKGAALNRMAILRARLARELGFSSWAELALDDQAEAYSPSLRSIGARRELLHEWHAAVTGALSRLPEIDGSAAAIDSYLSSVDIAWAQVMRDSGFGDPTLQNIWFDAKARPDRWAAGAYEKTLRPARPAEILLRADDLNFADQAEWEPASTYITLPGYGGLTGLRSTFHEGGHALEQLFRRQYDDRPVSASYDEVAAFVMEHFLAEPGVLREMLTPVRGRLPTEDEFRHAFLWLQRRRLEMLRATASQGLFDLALWDYDYAAPGAETFLSRFESLQGGRSEWPTKLLTSHYTEGGVTYAAYSFAFIATPMVVAFVSDELERATGRRDWLAQPRLAAVLRDRIYRDSWRLPFPENLERVTGRKFDIGEAVAHYVRCAERL